LIHHTRCSSSQLPLPSLTQTCTLSRTTTRFLSYLISSHLISPHLISPQKSVRYRERHARTNHLQKRVRPTHPGDNPELLPYAHGTTLPSQLCQVLQHILQLDPCETSSVLPQDHPTLMHQQNEHSEVVRFEYIGGRKIMVVDDGWQGAFIYRGGAVSAADEHGGGRSFFGVGGRRSVPPVGSLLGR